MGGRGQGRRGGNSDRFGQQTWRNAVTTYQEGQPPNSDGRLILLGFLVFWLETVEGV